MLKLLRLFEGYTKYRVPCCKLNDVLRAAVEAQAEYFDLYMDEEHAFFSITRGEAKKLVKTLICCEKVREYGLFHLIRANKARAGLVIGLILCVFVLELSTKFVWRVQINTNGSEDTEKIRAALYDIGVRPGAFIPAMNGRKAENLVLLACPELSYVSIITSGTSAVVNTDERVTANYDYLDKIPRSLVASEDGYIVRYQIFEGQTAVVKGQIVEKGDVLISGLKETKHHGTVQVKADGHVYAMVRREISVTYPRVITVKYYTGKSCDNITIGLFSLDIDINDVKIPYDNYTSNQTNVPLSFFGVITLPITVYKTVCREYVYEELTLTEQLCKEYAEQLYEQKLSETTADGELCEIKKSVAEDENGCTITSEVWMIVDICEEKSITDIEGGTQK